MNFLQLAQRAYLEAGLTGEGPPSVSDTAALSTQQLRMVGWVGSAWIALVNEDPDWKFLWDRFSFNTSPGFDEHRASDNQGLDEWDREVITVYDDRIGRSDEQDIHVMDWDTFRTRWKIGEPLQGRPYNAAVNPAGDLVVAPVPDVANYVLSGEYKKQVTIPAGNADVPPFAERFHDLIWMQALEYHAAHEEIPWAQGAMYSHQKRAFDAKYRPKLFRAAALA